MVNGSGTNEAHTGADLYLFVLFSLVLFGTLALGGLAFVPATCVVFSVRYFKISAKHIGIATAALGLVTLCSYLVLSWRLGFYADHIKWWAVVLYESMLTNQYEGLFQEWALSFQYPLYWVVLHGLLGGALFVCVNVLYDRLNPIRVERQRRAAQNSNSHISTKKPRRQNVDNMSANAIGETVLGNATNTGKVITITDKSLNTHCLVVGTTGSGKTVTVLNMVESFINRGLPVLYIDGKGTTELGERICAYAQERGIAGRMFSMTGKSVTYNPLYSGSYTSKKDRIIEVREWTQPHYKTIAEGYLQMVFSALDLLKEPVNFLNVAEYMNATALLNLNKSKLRAGEINKEIADKVSALIKEQNFKQEDLNGLIAEIRNLARSEIGHLFKVDNANNLILEESLKRGEVIYMGLNPLQFPTLAGTLGRLIVNDFKATLDPATPRQTLVVFDEFGVFSGEQVLNIINQGRSAGVCAVLTVQSTSDIGRTITKNSEQFIEQVFSNCNNYLVHRVNSAKNAETLSQILGTEASEQLTTRVSDGVGVTGEGSIRATREFVYHPDMIKNLATGQAIYLDRNTGAHVLANVRMAQI